jgi:hypothetical protein
MGCHVKPPGSFLFFAVVTLAFAQDGTRLVSQTALSDNEILATVPLSGYRPLTEQFFAMSVPRSSSLHGLIRAPQAVPVVPQTWIFDSARAANLGNLIGNSSSSTDDLHWLISADMQPDYDLWTSNSTLEKYRKLVRATNKANTRTIKTVLPSMWQPGKEALLRAEPAVAQPEGPVGDPLLVALLPDTELAFTKSATGGIEIHPATLAHVQQAYTSLVAARQATAPAVTWSYIDRTTAALHNYPNFQEVAEFNTGSVAFGRPIRLPIQQPSPGMLILQLAFSVKDLDYREVSSIILRTQVDNEVTVTDMLPLHQTKEEPVAVTPSIAGAGLTPIFTGIKPTIIAYGLQQSDFSWELSGQAVASGAHRFLAVLQVPPSQRQVSVRLTIACKMKPTFLSEGHVLSAVAPRVLIPLQ